KTAEKSNTEGKNCFVIVSKDMTLSGGPYEYNTTETMYGYDSYHSSRGSSMYGSSSYQVPVTKTGFSCSSSDIWNVTFHDYKVCDNVRKGKWREGVFYNDDIIGGKDTTNKVIGTFTDIRDSKTYRYVKIGTQTWMAENLNYKVGKSTCYDNSEGKCNECGQLYDFATASKACPAGWHLPSDTEWKTLGNAVGSNDFSTLPCGRHYDGKFLHYGTFAFFWTATESDSKSALGSGFEVSKANLDIGSISKSYMRSVRCVKD
ncbi:MAG: hypothetical protein LBH25_03980, partial [Fibromonadaceae bacterium]|nr:hypothetical protein [Fibromonadaceae bacterium]